MRISDWSSDVCSSDLSRCRRPYSNCQTAGETPVSDKDIHAAGMKVRRKILGEAHVDSAVANTTPLNREFQDLLTRYGWGEIWTRDRTSVVDGTRVSDRVARGGRR